VQGISDIITIPGVINRDFADVKTTMAGMGYAVMGTAQRSGENRAKDAAVAAMASPLLEAGAIDGARGILINITGSSSLKLSEVNEASSLIQSAAHEDANIIFGAVLDESMGDEVKITVIATGFKQQEQDANSDRRERMLAGTTPRVEVPSKSVPSLMHAEVPVAPVSAAPIAAVVPAAEASAPEPAEALRATEPVKIAMVEAVAKLAEPELVPVPQSVFDDDFFRVSARANSAGKNEAAEEWLGSSRHAEPSDSGRGLRVQYAEASREAGGEFGAPEVRVPSFTASLAPEPVESDELDIPAFLRRGN
jgi:cell division protein FtsZ